MTTQIQTENNLYNPDDDLEALLHVVDGLFGVDPLAQPELHPYLYSLGRYPYGWNFCVTSSWQKWSDKNYKYNFGCYRDPRYAVMEFLDYVWANNINPMELM